MRCPSWPSQPKSRGQAFLPACFLGVQRQLPPTHLDTPNQLLRACGASMHEAWGRVGEPLINGSFTAQKRAGLSAIPPATALRGGWEPGAGDPWTQCGHSEKQEAAPPLTHPCAAVVGCGFLLSPPGPVLSGLYEHGGDWTGPAKPELPRAPLFLTILHPLCGGPRPLSGRGSWPGPRCAASRRNWCAYVVSRTVSCVLEDGVEAFVKPDYQPCGWGQPQCTRSVT